MEARTLIYELILKRPFGLSRSVSTSRNIVLLDLQGEGWGESAPLRYFGETPQKVQDTLPQVAAEIENDFVSVEEEIDRLKMKFPLGGSILAALDMALYDIISKRANQPLFKFFGYSPPSDKLTSYTIGIASIEEMLAKIEEAQEFPILKVKMGRDVEHDIKIIKEIKKRTNKIVRVDANEGWSLHEARRITKLLADLEIELIEQPLPRDCLEDTAMLTKDSPLPIILDEDVQTYEDVEKVAGKCDGINIKLMKCGGLREARRMIGAARDRGLKIMLGCMIESSVAITAGSHIAAAMDYIDLDGNLLVSNDPFEGTKVEDGYLRVPDRPGLGVLPKPEFQF